jgi:hypothetical protein
MDAHLTDHSANSMAYPPGRQIDPGLIQLLQQTIAEEHQKWDADVHQRFEAHEQARQAQLEEQVNELTHQFGEGWNTYVLPYKRPLSLTLKLMPI